MPRVLRQVERFCKVGSSWYKLGLDVFQGRSSVVMR